MTSPTSPTSSTQSAANDPLPAWPYVLLLIATGLYLSVELPFGALLIDVVGSDATSDQISRLETVGRLIAGVALALAWCGSKLIKGLRAKIGPIHLFLRLTATAAIAIPAVYWGQKELVDMIVQYSSAETRQAAAQSVLLRREIFSGSPKIQGIDINPEELSKPDWKAFSALAPLLGLYYPNVISLTGSGMTTLLKNEVGDQLGDIATFRKNVFEPAMDEVRKAHQKYEEGVRKYREGVDGISAQAQREWDNYLYRLRSRGIRTLSQANRHARQVRQNVRDNGLPVSNSWMPSDERGFKAAVRQKALGELGRAYSSAVEDALGRGASLPNNLDEAKFWAHPTVQAKIRAELSLPRTGPAILTSIDDEALLERVYKPMVDARHKRLAEDYLKDTASFQDSGANEEIGRNAVRAVVVPPIALALSLLGMTVHIFKFTRWLLLSLASLGTQRVRPLRLLGSGYFQAAAYASLAAVIGYWLYQPERGVTASPFYQFAEKSLTNALPYFPTVALTGVIEAQRSVYDAKHALGDLGAFPAIAAYVTDGAVPSLPQLAVAEP